MAGDPVFWSTFGGAVIGGLVSIATTWATQHLANTYQVEREAKKRRQDLVLEAIKHLVADGHWLELRRRSIFGDQPTDNPPPEPWDECMPLLLVTCGADALKRTDALTDARSALKVAVLDVKSERLGRATASGKTYEAVLPDQGMVDAVSRAYGRYREAYVALLKALTATPDA